MRSYTTTAVGNKSVDETAVGSQYSKPIIYGFFDLTFLGLNRTIIHEKDGSQNSVKDCVNLAHEIHNPLVRRADRVSP